jgi:hypothetical protein
MKKTIITAIFAVITASISFGQSLVSNQAPPAQISNTSAQVSCDLYGAAGTRYKIVVIKKTSGGNFLPDDSLFVNGLGFANPRNIAFTLDSLVANTTYFYEFRLYKAYGDSSLISTTVDGYYFTTTPTPQSGVITSVVVQPIVNGLKLIVTGNTNGSISNLIGYANQVSYTGTGWQYQSELDTLPGLFTTFTDTLIITGLSVVQHKIQIRLIPNNGMPVVVSVLYYGTPLIGTKPTVYTPTINVGIDTVQIISRVTKGNAGDDSVFVRIYDSTGTNVLYALTKQAVNTNILNYFRKSGLSENTAYVAEIVGVNSAGRDSLRVAFRTLVKPKLAGPTLTLSQSITATCGKLSFSQMTVSPVSGDTCSILLLASTDGNFYDTVVVYSQSGISIVKGLLNVEVTGLRAGTHYYFKIIGLSKDRVMSTSNVVDVWTLSGDKPNAIFSVDNATSTTPKLHIVGSGNCDYTLVFYSVVNISNGDTVFSGMFANDGGSIDRTLTMPNFPNGTYRAIVFAWNSYDYSDGMAIEFQRGIATGIVEHLKKNPDAFIQVYVVSGIILWQGKYSEFQQLKSESKNKVIIIYSPETGESMKMIW